MNEAAFLQYLTDHDIPFEYYAHEAVYTTAESDKYHVNIDAMSVKNLFLGNQDESRHYLYSCPAALRTDLKKLGKALGETRLHFASEESLTELLGLSRGSVTPLAIINDTQQKVSLLFEESFWQAPRMLLHPLVNTASIVLTHEGFTAYLKSLNRTFQVVKVEADSIYLVDP